MSATTAPVAESTGGYSGGPKNYLNNGNTIASWLLTTDHKRIAILYLVSITIMTRYRNAMRL